MKKSIFDALIAFAIKRKKVIYFMIGIFIILGIMTYQSMTKEVMPEIKYPDANIYIEYPGTSPVDIEKLVTDKVEAAISGVGDIKKVESSSSSGYSSTSIRFVQGVNIAEKVTKIKSELDAIRSELPKDISTPLVEEYSENKEPILYYSITSDGTTDELRESINLITNSFKKISGVSKVKVYGLPEKEISITVDPDLLSLYQLQLSQISTLIANQNIDVPVGVKSLNERNYTIRVMNSFKDIEDIKNIILTQKNGFPIFVKDIATVEYNESKPVNYALMPQHFKTEDEELKKVVSVNVYKKQGVDVIKVSDSVKDALENLQETKLPQTLDFVLELDMSSYVKTSIDDVFGNAFSGLLVVVIVLFFFIDFRESIIVSLVIPLSLLIAISVFKFFGLTINILTILGLIISLGMLVDNAIVVIESIEVLKNKYDNMKDLAREATNVVANAIFSSTVTTVCAFVPLTMLTGDIGLLLKPIPIAVVLTLVASLILSLTVTPMVASTFIKLRKEEPKKITKWFYVGLVAVFSLLAFMNKGVFTPLSFIGAITASLAIWFKLFKLKGELHETKFIHGYKEMMKNLLASAWKRWSVIFLSLILFVASMWLLSSDAIKKNSLPVSDSKYLYIEMKMPAGSTIGDAKLAIEQAQPYFRKDNIEGYSVNLTSSGGSLFIRLVDKKDRNTHSAQIQTDLLTELKAIPNAQFLSEESEGATSSTLKLRLTSTDRDALEQDTKMMIRKIEALDIVKYTTSSSSDGAPELHIEFDHQQAAFLGLNTLEMASAIQDRINGKKVTNILENGQKIKVILRNEAYKADELKDIESMLFMNVYGENIPFVQVASVVETRGPSTIMHINSEKVSDITIGTDQSTATSSLVNEINEVIASSQSEISDKVELSYAGSYEDMQMSNKDMVNKLVIVIVLIFLVLLVLFDSFIQSFVVILAVPMAVIGVAFGYYTFNITFGLLSLLGIVSLAGIAVNDSIVLIDTVNQLRQFNKMSQLESIVEAGYSRFNPVLATSITTIAGVLPLALYNEDYAQIAWTIIFGLIASTLLILVLVPVFLCQLEKLTKKGRAS